MNDVSARFCTSCGTPLVAGVRFCTACGAPAATVSPTAAVAPPQPPPPPPAVVAPPPPPPAAATSPPPPPPPPPATATPPPPPPPVPATPPPPPPPPTAAVQPAPQPAVAPASNGDRVVAIIPNASLGSGFMSMKRTTYTLVLTQHRVIFAEVTKEMMKAAVADARDMAKADGKGFFGQWGAQLTAYSKMAEAYLRMSPEQALAQNSSNFAIDKVSINKAKLHRGDVGDQDVNSTPDRLVLKTAAGKYDLQLGSGLGQAKKALIEAAMI